MPALAQQPIKVGIVTPVRARSRSLRVPARNAAELMTEFLNAGGVPARYTLALDPKLRDIISNRAVERGVCEGASAQISVAL